MYHNIMSVIVRAPEIMIFMGRKADQWDATVPHPASLKDMTKVEIKG